MSSLLPPNATPFELALEASTERIGDVPVPVGDLWNPDTCQVEVLPWLGWALSVDDWDSSWPESTKRAVIKNSLKVHMIKGTVGAVRQALSAAGYPDVVIKEWFETGGSPYTGRVTLRVYAEGITASSWDDMLRVIDGAKNVRSLITLRFCLVTQSSVPVIGVACTIVETITVYPQ